MPSAQSVLLQPPAPLTIRFLNASAGDAVIVTVPTGEVVLYTAVLSSRSVADLKRTYGLTRIDVVIPGASDRMNGGSNVIPSCAAAGLTGTFTDWQKCAGATSSLRNQTDFSFGEVRLMVIPAPPTVSGKVLPVPAVRIDYGNFSALLTGNTPVAQMGAWLRSGHGQRLGPVDVYATTAQSGSLDVMDGWLRSVRPRQVVVRVGPEGGLPVAVVGAYQQAGAAVWRTDLQGAVTVSVGENGWYRVKAESGLDSGVLPPVGREVPALPPALDALPPATIPPGN